MPVERVAHAVERVLGELLGVVELVVVDQVPEPLDRAAHLHHGAVGSALGLVAPGTKRVTIGPSAQIPRLVFSSDIALRVGFRAARYRHPPTQASLRG